jgi:hypothetical protein
VKGAEVHHELLLESHSGTLEKLRARGDKEGVIDIEQQVRSVGAVIVDEQRGVRLGLHKAEQDQVRDKAVISCLRRLLQAVEGLVEPTQ